MSIEAEAAGSGVISTRNGVPPVSASDPPGGVPVKPDPDTKPHVEERDGSTTDLPKNEPPQPPPSREAHHRSHHNNRHK